MSQMGFFDMSDRLNKLSQEGDRLEILNKLIDWEVFRAVLDKALNRPNSNNGRPPFDCVLMFKILILQSLYNCSDEQMQFFILDRLSFMRFLKLGLESRIPDARTIWLFRETLKKANVMEKLFLQFETVLQANGFEAKGGQMVDAHFIEVPRQHNKKDENKLIKETSKAPATWSAKKKAHKDLDARWTKKNKRTFYGYKNHVNVDKKHKLIRTFNVTSACVHDSQRLGALLSKEYGENVWADSAYQSEDQEAALKAAGYKSQIIERAYRGKPLTEKQKEDNKQKSKIRARVEHVFGHIKTSMNGAYVKTIGQARAEVKIAFQNLTYNMTRFCILKKQQEKCA